MFGAYERWQKERRYRASERRASLRKRVPFLLEVLPKNSVGAEIGVFKGQFSELLVRHLTPKELHLIDSWYFLTPHWHWGGGNRSTVDAVVKILKRWKREIEQKVVFVHIGDDRDVLRQFPDEYFDWVYLDSSHLYEHTVQELEILKEKVKKEGLIAGDDWQPDTSHRHHGVYKAVNEFVNEREYSIVYSSAETNQWAIQRSKLSQ